MRRRRCRWGSPPARSCRLPGSCAGAGSRNCLVQVVAEGSLLRGAALFVHLSSLMPRCFRRRTSTSVGKDGKVAWAGEPVARSCHHLRNSCGVPCNRRTESPRPAGQQRAAICPAHRGPDAIAADRGRRIPRLRSCLAEGWNGTGGSPGRRRLTPHRALQGTPDRRHPELAGLPAVVASVVLADPHHHCRLGGILRFSAWMPRTAWCSMRRTTSRTLTPIW